MTPATGGYTLARSEDGFVATFLDSPTSLQLVTVLIALLGALGVLGGLLLFAAGSGLGLLALLIGGLQLHIARGLIRRRSWAYYAGTTIFGFQWIVGMLSDSPWSMLVGFCMLVLLQFAWRRF